MLETSARLLRLLSLLQTRRSWSGAELAERLEVNARTLRRDIDRLRSLHYPVQATSGVAGGYHLGAGAALPPLQLDDDEALATSIALRTAAGGSVAGMEEAAVRALVKLEQVLPPRLRRRVHALRAVIQPLDHAGPTVDPSLLATLASACRDHEQVRFRYEKQERKFTRGPPVPSKTATSERSVEPIGLVHTGYRWYLVAWDLDRDDWRTFRVDRISGKAALGARFLPRPAPNGGDLKGYVSRSLSTAVYPVSVRVVLHAPLERVAERISPRAGHLQRLDAERCLLEAGGLSFSSLMHWVLMLDVDFEVQHPPELVEHLRTMNERLERVLTRAEDGALVRHRNRRKKP